MPIFNKGDIIEVTHPAWHGERRGTIIRYDTVSQEYHFKIVNHNNESYYYDLSTKNLKLVKRYQKTSSTPIRTHATVSD